MLFVADPVKKKPRSRTRKRTDKTVNRRHAPPQEGPLWILDDSRPAGPYQHRIHDDGLSLLCLSMIRQALMDERYFLGRELEDVHQWLSETAGWMLKSLGYWRNWENKKAYDLINQPYIEKQPHLFDLEETE